jgi:hypothetical protein
VTNTAKASISGVSVVATSSTVAGPARGGWPHEGESFILASAHTNASGEYTLSGLATGEYTVSFSAAGYTS